MSASQYVGIGIVVGYWAVLITTRWMFIARPNRRFTLARIDDAQYYLEPGGEPSLLDEARAVATGTRCRAIRTGCANGAARIRTRTTRTPSAGSRARPTGCPGR